MYFFEKIFGDTTIRISWIKRTLTKIYFSHRSTKKLRAVYINEDCIYLITVTTFHWKQFSKTVKSLKYLNFQI